MIGAWERLRMRRPLVAGSTVTPGTIVPSGASTHPYDRGRTWISPARFALLATTAVILAFAVLEASIILRAMTRPDVTVGLDFRVYQEATQRWLAGAGFYLPEQLAGPYLVNPELSPPVYPPTLLWLLVPMTVLPTALWYLVPIAIIGFSLWRLRPAVWTWPILAATLLYPRTWEVFLYGNPSMWVFAFLVAGFVWTWPLGLLPLKPTLAPFALIGVRRRAFWQGVGVFVFLGLPFGAMWLDYVTVLLNARNDLGPVYLFGELPIGVAMLVGWLGRG